MSFHARLIDLLKTDPHFVDDDGELVLAAVQDAAWKVDHALIRLLLSDPEVRAAFLSEIDGYWVFELDRFINYTAQKNFLDNSYTRFKNRIGLTVGGKFLRERGEVALMWPYKDCVLEGGQTKEEEKRKEIFFNEVLAQDEITRLLDPKVLTHFQRYTADGAEAVTAFRRDEDGMLRENLIIKGNNLLVLHTLKSQFRGRVKLIYIDPPYNTGEDSFGYNNRFNHSTWLTFLQNRLEIAREYLAPDGSIWINIDDNGAHYLKVLCDEIFGRDNFMASVVWQKRTSPESRLPLGSAHDYILVYAKNISKAKNALNRLPLSAARVEQYKNPDNDPRGVWASRDITGQVGHATESQFYEITLPSGRKITPPEGRCWTISESTFKKLLKDNRIWFGADGDARPRLKLFLSESNGSTVWTWWTNKEVGHNQEAKKEVLELFGAANIFETPKPERLLYRIITLATNPGDLVLDFFVGSGTTAAVAHKMGRQYIGIEQLDYTPNYPILRLQKVIGRKVKPDGSLLEELVFDQGGISPEVNWQGGGDFVACELMPYNEIYMDRIQAAQSSEELVQLWREMAENSFLNWYVNPRLPEEAVQDFIAIGQEKDGLEKQKHLLAALLDKNHLYVNLSEIDDARYQVSAEDKDLNRAFYGEAFNV